MINLDRVEAGELEVEAQVDKLLHLIAESLVVPCSVAGDPIKRKSQGFNFRFCPVGNDDRVDFAATEFAHCLPDRVAVDDDTLAVDDYRNDLSEMPDEFLKLLDLLLGVNSRMRGIRFDPLNRKRLPLE